MDSALTLEQHNVAPSWGNYLYQNVLPNIPTDWLLNANIPANAGDASPASATSTHSAASANLYTTDANGWNVATAQMPTTVMGQSEAAANAYYMNYYGGSIAPSLIAPSTSSTGSGTPSKHQISPSIDFVDKIVQQSPSPLASVGGSPPSFHTGRFRIQNFGHRNLSLDSDADCLDSRSQHSQHSEENDSHDHEHDEGVERDGMIWGMKVDEYRALSARERKRVRNRISARTFRAKRKEHLNSLESTLGAKDLEVKIAHEENMRLRRELAEVKRRLAQYEQKPY